MPTIGDIAGTRLAGSGKARYVDASMNVQLNGVRMPDGSVLPWALAFPRDFEKQFERSKA